MIYAIIRHTTTAEHDALTCTPPTAFVFISWTDDMFCSACLYTRLSPKHTVN